MPRLDAELRAGSGLTLAEFDALRPDSEALRLLAGYTRMQGVVTRADETRATAELVADDALRNTGASDATFDAVEKHLGHRALVEITLAIGFYQMLARLLETAEVEIEEPTDSFVRDVTR